MLLSKYGLSSKDRADIVISRFDEEGLLCPVAIVECKANTMQISSNTIEQCCRYDVKQSMEAVAKRLDGVHHDNMIKCFENTHHEAMAALPFDEAFFDWAYEAYRNACKAATATDE